MKYVKYPSEYKEWVNKLVRQFEFRLEFNGKTLTTNDISSIKITSDLLPSDTFTIGSSVSETLEFDLFMDSDDFVDKTIPVKPYMSLYTEVEINNVMTPVWQEVCLGVFYINPDGVIKKGLKTVSIKASSMLNHSEYGSRTYIAQDPFNGNITTIINDICSNMGITLKTTLPNITISNRDNINGMSYREVINYVALLYGGYARINNELKLEFFKMTDTGYTYGTNNYISLSKEDEELTIKKFLCVIDENTSISSGDGMISDTVEVVCPDMTQSLLDDILNTYLNYGYHAITCKIFGNPILEPGDRIKVIDVKGNTLELPLQSITYNLSGSGLSMDIKSKYKVNSITKGTSVRKAITELNQEILKTKIVVADEIEAVNSRIENLKSNTVSTEELKAVNAKIENLTAVKVNIEELEAANVIIENLKANKADIEQLNNATADIEKLKTDKADVTDLQAANANISNLQSDVSDINTLINGNLTSDNIQSLVLTSDKVTIENGLIKNAHIDSIDAGKINTGTINTNKVTIQSNDGSMLLKGNLQQFKDSKGNVRIQIGKDNNGNFTFVLYDETGKGQIINENGITASAISDGLIVNSMVSDTANISGSKLDINSLFTELNKSTKTLKASIIKFDDKNQTLDVLFNDLQTQIDDLESGTSSDLSGLRKEVSTNTTNISAAQGQISTLISNTTITKEDGTVVQLKDDYNSTKSTVNSNVTKIGTLETNLGNVSSKQSTLEQDLNGFKTTVSDNYASKSELTQTSDAIRVEIANTGKPQLMPYGDMQKKTTGWYSWQSNIVYEEVGGRRIQYVSPTLTDTDGYFGIKLPEFDVKQDEIYTVSFWIESSTITTLNYNYAQGTDNEQTINNVTFDNQTEGEMTRVSITFTATYTGITNICLGYYGTLTSDMYFRIHQACAYGGSIAYPYKPSYNEIYNNKAYFDNEGLGIIHDDGSSCKLTNNELRFDNVYGNKKMAIKKGSLYAYDTENGSLLGMFNSNKVNNSTYKGVTTGIAGSASYYAIGTTQELSDDDELTMKPYILIAQTDLDDFLGNTKISGGINFMNTQCIFHQSPYFNVSPRINGGLTILKDDGTPINLYYASSNNALNVDTTNFSLDNGTFYGGGLYGNDVLSLGYKLDGSYTDVIKLYSSIQEIEFLRPLNMNGYSIYNTALSSTVSSQSTYSMRLASTNTTDNTIYSGMTFTENELRYTCRETCHTYEEYIYDETEGKNVSTGKYICYCELPIFMAENIESDYHISIGKIGWGDYRIIEKDTYYFILESENDGFAFTYEVVAKRID